MRSAFPHPAPTSVTLPRGGSWLMHRAVSASVSGAPFSIQASNNRWKAPARRVWSGMAAFRNGRKHSSQSKRYSNRSGKIFSNRSLKYAAATGLAPPVEMPAEKLPCCTSAGNRNVQRAGSSATFTGIFCSRQSEETCRFTAGSSVAAMTSAGRGSRSSGAKGRRHTCTPLIDRISSATSGATTAHLGP